MTDLAKLLEKNDNIKLIGLSTDNNADEAKAFVKKYNLRYPHMKDPSTVYLDRIGLGIRGTPTSYIISPQGNLIGTSIGYDDMTAKKRYKYLKKLYAIYATKE
jgi:peroxiredoxin